MRNGSVERVLQWIAHRDLKPLLILGDATGVDAKALEIAKARGWKYRVHVANWSRPWAGAERNGRMMAHALELQSRGWKVIVLAFPALHARGTGDAIKQAEERHLRYIVFRRRRAVA